MNFTQIKLEVNDSYKKYEKIKTDFEPTDNSDVLNKAYLDESLSKTEGHLFFLVKDHNEFKLQYNKQCVEEILVQRAVKTTIQILYDKGLFDNFQKTDKVLKDFWFTKRRKTDLSEPVNDDIK